MKGFLNKITEKLKQYEQSIEYDELIDDGLQEKSNQLDKLEHEEDIYQQFDAQDLQDDDEKYNRDDNIADNEEFADEQESSITASELDVDLYQTENEIVVVAFVPGIKPSAIDVNISNNTILTINIARVEPDYYSHADFFSKELYWGPYEKTIMLPTEVDPDQANAHENKGVLKITLPKLQKTKKAKIKVRSR